MASALDALKAIIAAKATAPDDGSLPQDPASDDPAAALAALHGASQDPSNIQFSAGNPYTFAGTSPTQGELNTPFELAQSKQADAANAKDLATAHDAAALHASLFDPDQIAARNAENAGKIAVAAAPNQAKAEGDVAVEQMKTAGVLAQQKAKAQATQDLVNAARGGNNPGSGGSAGGGGNPGSVRMSGINGAGEPTFTTANPMSALVQRAHNQLADARNETMNALEDAEKRYPGINAAARKADQESSAPSWASFIMGNSGKYGGASDLAGAKNDRLKYTLGVPTPFSNLAQSTSFANIEQMAGQLPGVRGLSTLTPLFKQHQANWGNETPLATIQRLQHMYGIMGDTLGTIETGGASTENPQDAILTGQGNVGATGGGQ